MTSEQKNVILVNFLKAETLAGIFYTLKSLDRETRHWLYSEFLKTSGFNDELNGVPVTLTSIEFQELR